MSGAGVNAIAVLGRELLLVDLGGGTETHLVEEARDAAGRPAVAAERFDSSSPHYAPSAGAYDQAVLLAPRWKTTTLCGREWEEMAAGESGGLHRWHETALAPTCRSCLRIVDTWFPQSDTPGGVELLAAVIAEKVEAFGSAQVMGVPAEHVEAVRRAARKHLRAKGFRSNTHVLDAALFVVSDDAFEAIDPDVKRSWIEDAMSGLTRGQVPDNDNLRRAGDPIDWHTWVVDA